MRKLATKGFTLLEVIIAVVILAIGLSSLFASEVGAVRVAQRARGTTVATLLARCKMAEIEEHIGKEGWPGDELDERDECCEGAEHEGFSCEWKVERIVLPELDEEATEEGLSEDAVEETAEQAKEVAQEGTAGAPSALEMAQSVLGASGGNAGALPGADGEGGGGILSMLGASGGGEGGDPLASMAMSLTYPIIKPVIEEGVRRATVTVKWTEGTSEQSFEVVQFLVNEQPIILPTGEEDADGGTPDQAGGNATEDSAEGEP